MFASSSGNEDVTSYPVHRPDGNWSLMLVNRNETQPRNVAVAFQDGDAKGFEHAADMRQRGGEILGHGLAGGFVIGVHCVARRGGIRVESYSDVRGLLLFEDVEERVGENEERL